MRPRPVWLAASLILLLACAPDTPGPELASGRFELGVTQAVQAWEGPYDGPVGLDGAAIAWDPGRGATLLVGGIQEGMATGQIYALNGPAWLGSELTLDAPVFGHAMAYLPELGMVVFGGWDQGGAATSDLQVVGTGTVTPLGGMPAARAQAAMAAGSGRILMHGGVPQSVDDAPLGDTWMLYDGGGGLQWSPLGLPDLPGANHAMVYDTDANQWVMVGLHGPGSQVYRYGPGASEWEPAGVLSGASPGAGLVYDPKGQRLVYWGPIEGSSAQAAHEGIWNGSEYQWTLIGAPPAPSDQRSAYDEGLGKAVFFAGSSDPATPSSHHLYTVTQKALSYVEGDDGNRIVAANTPTSFTVVYTEDDAPVLAETITWTSGLAPAAVSTDADGRSTFAHPGFPAEGLHSVTASQRDGLELGFPVTVVAAPDAGALADAGAEEDAGPDAGQAADGGGWPDGGDGAPDGGPGAADGGADGGPEGPLSLYGCASAGGGTFGLLALLAVALALGASRRRAALLALLLVPTLASAEAPPSLAYLGVVGASGMEASESEAISEYIQSELQGLGRYKVLGPLEIKAFLGLEAQRQLLGCGEDSSACMAEIGGALGSDRALVATLSRIETSVLVHLSLLDVARSRLVGRVGARIKSDGRLDPLLDAIPRLLAELVAKDAALVRAAPTRLTWLVGLRADGEVLRGGLVGAVSARARGEHLGVALTALLRPPNLPDPAASRPLGLRLEGLVSPGSFGPVHPYALAGATALFPSLTLRAGLGSELRLGPLTLLLEVAYERLVTDEPRFAADYLLVGAGVALRL